MTNLRKIMFILLSIILFTALFTKIFGAVTKNYAPKYGTTTAKIVFRNKPVISSTTKIKEISSGTQVKMVAEVDNFYIVQLGTNEVGYVSKSYVTSSTVAPTGAIIYTSKTSYYAYVKNTTTNLRQGPATTYSIVTVLKKDDKVQVIGTISNFSLVLTADNTVGMIRSDLISKTTTTTVTPTPELTVKASNEEKIIFDLINAERKKNGIPALAMDAKLKEIAGLKADEMVEKNYFSHTSPTYGSPFTMMKNFGITYRTAGENIAGNPSLQNTVTAWMNSEGHRKNILSNSYNYIGVGVTKSEVYGYVIVTDFVGR